MVHTWSPALHQVDFAVQTSSCLNTDHHRVTCTDIARFNLHRNPAGWHQHAHFPDEQTDIYKASQQRRRDSIRGWPDSETESLASERCPRGNGGGTPPLTWMDAFPGCGPRVRDFGSSHDCNSCSRIRRKGEDFAQESLLECISSPPPPAPHNPPQRVGLLLSLVKLPRAGPGLGPPTSISLGRRLIV